MMTRALCILVVVFPLCASSRGAQLIGDGLRTVAFQGQAATGTTGQFNDFGGMDINDSGQIAFRGGMFSLSGVTTTTNTGIWVEKTPGQLTLLAREGSTAPGTSGKFGDFVNDGPIINNRGEVAFENTLSSPGLPQTLGNNTGVWSQGGGGVLKLIARSDASAPGTSSIFIGVFATELNNSGGVAFSGNLPTNPPGFGVSIPGLWRTGSDGQVRLISLQNRDAPGTNYTFRDFYLPALSDSGHVAFKAEYFFERYGIWRESADGVLTLVTKQNDVVPGTTAQFLKFGDPSINNLGNVAFAATLGGAGINTSNDGAIFSERVNGGLLLMAREGDLAPGTVGRFSEFGVPRANDRGQTAFIAVLRDAGLEPLAAKGLWLENTNGVLELIAGPSHIAPGTDRQFQVVNGFAINNYGQVAFDAYLGGSYTDGIWAQNRAGQLVPIALLDQRIDVSNNPAAPDIRTINYLSAGGFNDRGQVAFFATFAEGGRGIFISDLATIPEPASLSLLFAGAYLLLSGGRRR